jgi:hypothetical protein
MKSCIKTAVLLLVVLSVVLTVQASAGWKPRVVLGPGEGPAHQEEPYHQSWHRTLSPDTLYVLTGFYYVDSLYSITIPAGTVVMGDTTATLVIQRGAQIHATGTQERPVVFTSKKDPGQRNPGDWGGVIILGEAPVNRVEPVIEGGLVEGHFGGSDPDDDSGEFYYCRIEFPGHRIEEGNEVNGLTMGGVGRETEIHHVQVSYSNDDSFEWFGGNDDQDYLVVLGGLDDVFDTDYGHTGRHQFCFAVRDPLWSDLEGESNGFESDSWKPPALTPPITAPVFANCTIVGPERTNAIVGNLPNPNAWEYGAVIRRAARNKLHNSVIMGFPWGLSIRDQLTHEAAVADEMNFHYTSIQASALAPGSTTVHEQSRWPGTTTPPGVDAWFAAEPGANAIHSQPRMPDDVGLTDMSDLNNPNPIPLATSELVTVPANWAHPDVSTYFQQVTYRGAFDPGRGMESQWTAGWTNFDPQNTDYDPDAVGVEETVATSRSLSQNVPNPFNPVTKIAYAVEQGGPATIEITNVAGRLVKTFHLGELNAGAEGSVVWDGMDDAGEQCASGVYLYRISTPHEADTRRMVMLK